MDAVEFLKEKNRMCHAVKCESDSCPLFKYESCISALVGNEIEEAVSAVEEWSKSHHIKTRQSEFLKHYPNVVRRDNIIDIPPCHVESWMKDTCHGRSCDECRHDYWMEEID